jgi:hypothetical protein
MWSRLVALASLSLGACACGAGSDTRAAPPTDAGPHGITCDPAAPPTRTISCVDSFTPGPGAGFGQDDFPEIIYGDPKGGGEIRGSLDVLSLGMGGEIVVGFGGNGIVDGDGVDFIVFENAFYVGENPTHPWADLGEVAVSDDGVTWTTYPCDTTAYPFTGCAGWHAVDANDTAGISSFDPAVAGGDQFDLKDIGVSQARLLRIRDKGTSSAAPSAGFDLDAAAIVNQAVAAP